jgi:non-specific serine/threonine protein kinase
MVAHPQAASQYFRHAREGLTPSSSQAAGGKGHVQSESDAEHCDIVLTTYGMTRDLEWLAKRKWFYVILDEAQNIKNPAASQTRAVKALLEHAGHRLALTGTPIENRLGDLWSLFDFLNKGLLGSAQTFKRFAGSLEKNPDGYARLRRVVQPCILRRMKTDKTVIADLPEKVEIKTYAPLARTQVVLYQKLQERFGQELESVVEGMKRRGLVLSYLMKFKQICNHPDQYAGSGTYPENESGKFLRLRELCETIREKRERVLVFTQFSEIIPALDQFLYTVFGLRGVNLHGGTPVVRRREIVAKFQGEAYIPYFILSVKAGGTGLNLTAARHVIHFDRWWNPAVERQAEDRAYRIGQIHRVMVHKFICRGTVEERIDEMIERKKNLADRILDGSNGQGWITELSNKELREIFTLKLTAQAES